MYKTSFLKIVDKTIGRSLVLCWPRPIVSKTPIDVRNVLFLRPGGIGDAVLLIPTIHAFQQAFSHCSIDILAEKRNSALFFLSPHIRRIYRYDKPCQLFSAIHKTYDLVIDTEQWHQLSAVVARLIGAPMLIGYATNEREKLFTHSIPYAHDEYEINSFLHLLIPLTGELTRDRNLPFLTVPPHLTQKAISLLTPLSSQRIVTIFPGSSIRERKWGSGRFHQTAKLLCEKGYSIVVVGGKEDIAAGEEIVSSLSGALNLCGRLSLPETAAVLKESSLLITGDSGIMHIGAGLGMKIVSLFGPGREKKWAPRGENCIVINKHLPCSPCTTFGYTPKCKRNAECMKQITVEEVFAAAMTLLEK